VKVSGEVVRWSTFGIPSLLVIDFKISDVQYAYRDTTVDLIAVAAIRKKYIAMIAMFYARLLPFPLSPSKHLKP
jgi:hypothetical protein